MVTFSPILTLVDSGSSLPPLALQSAMRTTVSRYAKTNGPYLSTRARTVPVQERSPAGKNWPGRRWSVVAGWPKQRRDDGQGVLFKAEDPSAGRGLVWPEGCRVVRQGNRGITVVYLHAELPVVGQHQESREVRVRGFGQQAAQRAVEKHKRRQLMPEAPGPTANSSLPALLVVPDFAHGRPRPISAWSSSTRQRATARPAR